MYEFIICPVCKKEKFIASKSDYQWKIDDKYFCSYTCFRKIEKAMIEKDRKKKRFNILWHK